MYASDYLSVLDLSPYRLLNPQRLHFVLWGYFDGSKDGKGKEYITLAGIVSSEIIWSEFEKQWMAVLQSYGVESFHMVDAMARQGDFKDWPEEKVMKCVHALLGIIQKFAGLEFVIKACTVKLEDYRKAKDENTRLRSAPAMCVHFCCGSALPYERARPETEHPRVIFYFDRNEEFRNTIEHVWRKGKKWSKNKKHPAGWPDQVEQILPVCAKKVPALQAADVIAWIINGYYKGDTRARSLFPLVEILGALCNAMYRFYDYEQIKQQYDKD